MIDVVSSKIKKEIRRAKKQIDFLGQKRDKLEDKIKSSVKIEPNKSPQNLPSPCHSDKTVDWTEMVMDINAKVNKTELNHILREYWSHFKAKKQGFQRRLNEILETARTYGFQFRDN